MQHSKEGVCEEKDVIRPSKKEDEEDTAAIARGAKMLQHFTAQISRVTIPSLSLLLYPKKRESV